MARTQLGLLAFGGNSHSGATPGDPIVEVWECHIAVACDPAGIFFIQGEADGLAALLNTWFQHVDSRISSTESLDYVKWNEYSLATGRQITDPTVISFPGGSRGGGGVVNPVSSAFKISLDDSTRNPRHRGGFFPPRTSATIAQNGRLSPSQVAPMLANAHTLLAGINAGFGAYAKVCVWSRRDKAMHEVNRIRIGDVPDNISRRRNHLIEAYAVQAL